MLAALALLLPLPRLSLMCPVPPALPARSASAAAACAAVVASCAGIGQGALGCRDEASAQGAECCPCLQGTRNSQDCKGLQRMAMYGYCTEHMHVLGRNINIAVEAQGFRHSEAHLLQFPRKVEGAPRTQSSLTSMSLTDERHRSCVIKAGCC
jgi:hypothetical protein